MNVGVMSFQLVYHIQSVCVALIMSFMACLMFIFWWKSLQRGKMVQFQFSMCVFWDSGVMNQQRAMTARLQTATRRRLWEIWALLALAFRDTTAAPALLGLLFPLWLQRSQPDKTQTKSLEVSLFDTPAQICDTLETTVWVFRVEESIAMVPCAAHRPKQELALLWIRHEDV